MSESPKYPVPATYDKQNGGRPRAGEEPPPPYGFPAFRHAWEVRNHREGAYDYYDAHPEFKPRAPGRRR